MFMRTFLFLGSRPVVGSSRSIHFGSIANIVPNDASFFSPPESLKAGLFSISVMFNILAMLLTLWSMLSKSKFSKPKAISCFIVGIKSCESKSWNTKPNNVRILS